MSFQIPNSYSARATSESPSASSNYSKPPSSSVKIYSPAGGTPAASFDPVASLDHSYEISPPESPHTSDDPQNSSRHSNSEVSPITESPKASTTDFLRVYSQSSNIPMPLRSQKYEDLGNAPLEWRYREPSPPKRDSASSILTNWDHFLLGAATGETGKPAHTSSSAVHSEFGGIAREAKSPLHLNAANGVGGGRDTTNLSIRQPSLSVIPKEPWKGASGRHTIIYPPCDKPLPPGKTPSFPRGTQKTSECSRDKTSGKMTYRKPVRAPSPPISDNSTGPNEGGGNMQLQVLPSPAEKIPINLPGTPSVKSSLSLIIPSDIHDHHSSSGADDSESTRTLANGIRFSPPRTVTSSIPLAQMQFSPSILKIDRSASSPERTITCKIHDQKPHLITPDITPMKMQSGLDLEAIENDFRAKMHHMHLEDQPPSRFSATTCATTMYDSPPATPEMSSNSPTPNPPLTILNRKRPVAATNISNPKVASRKPTLQEFKKSSRVAPVNVRLSKSLPKSPPEAQAVTRVATLEAKLENLRRRRSNLRTVIQERTNVVQLSSTAYDTASRHEIKRAVDGLHEELAEVIKDEHETGLQLHRAWKRHDTDSAYENSSLWVKRLAS